MDDDQMTTTRRQFEVYRDRVTGQIQLNLSVVGENGCGHGYRVGGPKFSDSDLLASFTLNDRDVREIANLLRAAPSNRRSASDG